MGPTPYCALSSPGFLARGPLTPQTIWSFSARFSAGRQLFEVGQHFTDDLRRLVSTERVAAFRYCDLSGKIFD